MPAPTTAFNNRELPIWPDAANAVPDPITGQTGFTHSIMSPVSQPTGTQPVSPTPFPDAPDTGATSRTSTFTAVETAAVARLNQDLGSVNGWLSTISSLVSTASAATLTTVAPATGPVAGGTAITLTGTNFTGSTGVLFGGKPATTVVVASSTSITCVAPAGLVPGSVVGVTVQNPNGNGFKSQAYTYAGAPATISGVSPIVGKAAGGLAVTITGLGFTGSTGVTFGGTAATGFAVNSDSNITCITPAHATGAVNVVVTDPAGNGTLTNGFTYQ